MSKAKKKDEWRRRFGRVTERISANCRRGDEEKRCQQEDNLLTASNGVYRSPAQEPCYSFCRWSATGLPPFRLTASQSRLTVKEDP